MRRIDDFELWCWRRLSRVLWTARRSNQSILKEISPEYWLEGLMLKLKLQYFLATWYEELTHWKRPWCWERLKAGRVGDDREWDGWMVLPTQWTWFWVSSRSWWWTGKPSMLRSMACQRKGHNWASPVLWPPHAKNWLIGKDSDDGRDWRQEEKGATEDEMVGWPHLLNGHEFEQALGVGDGQGSLVCCSPWGHKESHTTELKWIN